MTGVITKAIERPEGALAALKRASYRDLALYSTAKERSAIDLSENTNLWGAPPSALRTLRATVDESVSRYPTAFEPELRQALATYAGVSPDMIVTGCGSDDILDSTIRAFAEPSDVLCLPAPSFSMIPVFARTNGLVPVEVPLTAQFDADAEAMLETEARITYVCSPNNPTGEAFSREPVERIVREAAGLVIIDQAYGEFGGESFIDLVSDGRPVLVTRTLSKAFGLAGLRVGYGIGSPEIVREIMKARGPYKVSAVAERAALGVLENDQDWVAEHVADVVANRARFRQELSLRGIASLPSAANFVLIPMRDCAAIAGALARQGIGVRALPSLPGIGDAVRIGIGPWDLMERCLEALGTVA
jgi:histidinol-phosphate aminotransferase